MESIKRGRGTPNENADSYRGKVFECMDDGVINLVNVFYHGMVMEQPSIQQITLTNRLSVELNARLNMLKGVPIAAQNINPEVGHQRIQQFLMHPTIENEGKIQQKEAEMQSVEESSNENEQIDKKDNQQEPTMQRLRGLEEEDEEMPTGNEINKDKSMAAEETAEMEKKIAANLSTTSSGTAHNESTKSKSGKRKKDQTYKIEKIVDERYSGMAKQYLIKWAGYDESTWEPAKNFVKFVLLIEEFEKSKKGITAKDELEKVTPAKEKKKRKPSKSTEVDKTEPMNEEAEKKEPAAKSDNKSVPAAEREEKKQEDSPMKTRGMKRKSATMSVSCDSATKYQRIYMNRPKIDRSVLSEKLHTPTTRGAKQRKNSTSATPKTTANLGQGNEGVESKEGKKSQESDNEMVPETPQIMQNNNKCLIVAIQNAHPQSSPSVQNGFGFQRGLRPNRVLKLRTGLDGREELLVEYEGEQNSSEWVQQSTFWDSGPLAQSLQIAFLSKCYARIADQLLQRGIPMDDVYNGQK